MRHDMNIALLHAGVDTSLIVRPEGHQTPVTTMFVREDGTRRSVTSRAHTFNFHPDRYVSAFDRARAVILGSLFRAPFDDPEIRRFYDPRIIMIEDRLYLCAAMDTASDIGNGPSRAIRSATLPPGT